MFFINFLDILEHIEEPDYFLKKIHEEKLSIDNITDTLMRVKNSLNDEDKFGKIILATTRYWQVFDHIKDVRKMNKLIDWFKTKLPKDLKIMQMIYKQVNECNENLLHYLSTKGDLPELLKFLETSTTMSQSTRNKDNKMDFEDFVEAVNGEGCNFLHIICSKELKSFKDLELILNWIIKRFGLKTVEQMICKQTNEGNHLVLIISRHQNEIFFFGPKQYSLLYSYGQ